MAARQQTSGSGWFSKLVVVLLLALAIGLYLRIVMVPEKTASGTSPVDTAVADVPAPPESGSAAAPAAAEKGPSEPAVAAASAEKTAAAVSAPEAPAAMRELPQDQMDLIKRVFAPELARP